MVQKLGLIKFEIKNIFKLNINFFYIVLLYKKMAGLPPNVSYFMSRLQGLSTSHFKIFPQNSGAQSANKILRFELPSNTLLNLKSCRMFFNIGTSASAAAHSTRLPPDTRSFIDRMAIYMGGVLVQNSFSNYNVLVHAKKALGADRCSDSTLTHPEMCRAVSYHTGATLGTAGAGSESYEGTNGLGIQLAIMDWESFLGTAEPGIIDTGLFPQITIEITLADNVVCPIIADTGIGASPDQVMFTIPAAPSGTIPFASSGGFSSPPTGSATPAYSLDNITMQVEVLGMASSVLDEVVAQRVSQVGYLSIPFKNYFSFSSSHSTTSRVNVNSASWDRLWVAWRDSGGSSAAAPVVATGHKIAGAYTTGAAALAATIAASGALFAVDLGKAQYDNGGTFDTNNEKYLARYFRFQEQPTSAGAVSNYQLQINSANYPAYKLTVPEAYALTLNSIDVYDKTRKMSLDQYKKDYFVQCYRFCLPESDYSRLASGLDTRATSAQCALVTENVNSSVACFIYAECTSELRVANRAIELIV